MSQPPRKDASPLLLITSLVFILIGGILFLLYFYARGQAMDTLSSPNINQDEFSLAVTNAFHYVFLALFSLGIGLVLMIIFNVKRFFSRKK